MMISCLNICQHAVGQQEETVNRKQNVFFNKPVFLFSCISWLMNVFCWNITAFFFVKHVMKHPGNLGLSVYA